MMLLQLHTLCLHLCGSQEPLQPHFVLKQMMMRREDSHRLSTRTRFGLFQNLSVFTCREQRERVSAGSLSASMTLYRHLLVWPAPDSSFFSCFIGRKILLNLCCSRQEAVGSLSLLSATAAGGTNIMHGRPGRVDLRNCRNYCSEQC